MELARRLVELGYRSSGKTLSCEEFWQIKVLLYTVPSFPESCYYMQDELAVSQGLGMAAAEEACGERSGQLEGSPVTRLIRERQVALPAKFVIVLLYTAYRNTQTVKQTHVLS